MSKIKCIILLPLQHNTGAPVQAAELRGMLNRLLAEYLEVTGGTVEILRVRGR